MSGRPRLSTVQGTIEITGKHGGSVALTSDKHDAAIGIHYLLVAGSWQEKPGLIRGGGVNVKQRRILKGDGGWGSGVPGV
jgi:hypothetical protein